MAHSRGAGVLSVVMASVAAAALTGLALVTVATAGCDVPGYYVQSGPRVELVGGCLSPAELPASANTSPAGGVRPAAIPGGARP